MQRSTRITVGLIGLALSMAAAGLAFRHARAVRAQGEYEAALAAEQRGDQKARLDHLRAAIRLDPFYRRTYLNLGRYHYLETTNGRAAACAFLVPWLLRPGCAEAYACRAFTLKMTRQRGAALADYQKALKKAPDYAEAWYGLSALAYSMNNVEAAAAAARQAIAHFPLYADAHRNLAIALFALGRTNEAVREDRLALAINTNMPIYHANLGLHLWNADPKAARDAYQKAVALDPGVAGYWADVGRLDWTLGELDGAEAAFRRALDVEPDRIETLHDLGELSADRGKVQDAERFYRRILQLNPHDAKAQSKLTLLTKNTVMEAQLRAKAEARRGTRSDSADTHEALAEINARAGNSAQSADELRKAIRLDPENAACHKKLGRLLKNSVGAQSGEAEHELREAVRLNPIDPDGYILLGQILSDAGKFAEARAVFEDAAKRFSTDASVVNLAQVEINLTPLDIRFVDGLTVRLQGTSNPDFSHVSVIFTNAVNHFVNMDIHTFMKGDRPFDAYVKSDQFSSDLGRTFAVMKETSRAIAYYRQALARTTNRSVRCETTYDLADLYKNTGEADKGIALYEDLLKIYPGDEYIPKRYHRFLNESAKAAEVKRAAP